jgi:hypothetical protein
MSDPICLLKPGDEVSWVSRETGRAHIGVVLDVMYGRPLVRPHQRSARWVTWLTPSELAASWGCSCPG